MTLNPAILPDDLYQKLMKGRQTRPSDINPCYKELENLGWGYEGYVYLVRDQATGRKLVLKIYHDPFDHEPGIWDGLTLYASRVKPNPYGLYPITLIQKSGQIIALQYPFDRLYPLEYRVFERYDEARKSLVGQFCFMQSYLMSECGIGVIDPVIDNYLLAKDGQFHYVDYGLGIRNLEESIAVEYGLFGRGFALLLLSIYNINLRAEMPPLSNYAYDRPCPYSMCPALDDVAARNLWIKNIVSEVRSQNASVFLDPRFYWRLGMSLPRRVRFPQLLIRASQSIRFLKNVRDRLK